MFSIQWWNSQKKVMNAWRTVFKITVEIQVKIPCLCKVWQILWGFYPGTSKQSEYYDLEVNNMPPQTITDQPLDRYALWCYRQHNVHHSISRHFHACHMWSVISVNLTEENMPSMVVLPILVITGKCQRSLPHRKQGVFWHLSVNGQHFFPSLFYHRMVGFIL